MFGFCNFIRLWTNPASIRAALKAKKRNMTARCCETRSLLQRRRSHLTGKHKACLYNTAFVFEITGGVIKVNSFEPWFHFGSDHLTARFPQHNRFLWGKTSQSRQIWLVLVCYTASLALTIQLGKLLSDLTVPLPSWSTECESRKSQDVFREIFLHRLNFALDFYCVLFSTAVFEWSHLEN